MAKAVMLMMITLRTGTCVPLTSTEGVVHIEAGTDKVGHGLRAVALLSGKRLVLQDAVGVVRGEDDERAPWINSACPSKESRAWQAVSGILMAYFIADMLRRPLGGRLRFALHAARLHTGAKAAAADSNANSCHFRKLWLATWTSSAGILR